jgi:hypothetical protein
MRVRFVIEEHKEEQEGGAIQKWWTVVDRGPALRPGHPGKAVLYFASLERAREVADTLNREWTEFCRNL